MIEDLLKNESFLRYFPLIAGGVFVALFVSLGLWQLDRAAEKQALLELFESGGDYAEPRNFNDLSARLVLAFSGKPRCPTGGSQSSW